MIEVSQILKCKQLHARGTSIRAIAQELDVSRNTVRRYLRGAEPGKYQMKQPRQQPVRGGLREKVRELLKREQDRETPRKQRLTAARVHRLLIADGQTCAESTVRKLVREVRLDLRDPLQHAYLPLEYEPGVDAQVDFFEGVVDDRKKGRVKVYVLLVRACWSARCFAYAAPNQTRESLLEGLMRAFEFFGGVFQKLWFDNLTPAVKKVLKGRDREMQRTFEVFCAHYGFDPEFCSPGKGNEKGGVEGAVKYSRHEILSPIPEVDGRDDVQDLCRAWMERDASRVVRGKQETIGELFEREVELLTPLSPTRFDAARSWRTKVSPRAWIQTGTNFYSAPVEWVGHEVVVKLEAERVIVVGPNAAEAVHKRLYGREQMSLDIAHYLPLLDRKCRGLDRAVPMRRFLERVDPCWRALLADLRRRDGEVGGSRAFVQVVELCQEHGTHAVTEAVRKSVRHPEVSVGSVRFHLWGSSDRAAKAPVRIEYPSPAVHQGSPADYAVLTTAEVLHV